MTSKIELEKELKKLPLPATAKWPLGVWDVDSFKHGSMSMILYTPHKHDYQTPHDQDEIYVVFKGFGKLITPNKIFDFLPGDVLFVPAGDEHHFEEFSQDLVLWAVFYGPKGGESVVDGQ